MALFHLQWSYSVELCMQVIVNGKWARILKAAVVAYLKLLLLHLTERD